MNCSKCGTEIPPDERFCRNCGREVEWLAPTLYGGGAVTPKPHAQVTEQYVDPQRTESLNPPAQTARSWNERPPQTPTAPIAKQERKSLLVPITVVSILIALVSIGALAYIIMSKDKVAEKAPAAPEKPQPTASPSVAVSSATPSPTVQPTATPTPAPSPTPNTGPPPGARLGYCNDTNVFVRSSPDLNARPLTKISRGQKLWVIATSTNYSTWNGINSNWTQVQIYDGTLRGWVFSPFISY